MDRVGKSVNSIGIVEGLGAENLEEESITGQRRTVIYVLIGLDDPDEFLDRVVKVELNLVAGRTDRLVACELELGDQILVGVLGHSATLVSIQEYIVDVKGSRHQRLIVGDASRNGATDAAAARTAINIIAV